MKKFLSLVLVACLASFLAGCGDDKKSRRSKSSRASTPDLDDPEVREKIATEAVEGRDLESRDDVNYQPGSQEPYTGWVKHSYENLQVAWMARNKDGKRHGIFTSWYKDGSRRGKGHWKDGKLVSMIGWKPNGQKCSVTNVIDGNGIWVGYDDDGAEILRSTWKDGERAEW